MQIKKIHFELKLPKNTHLAKNNYSDFIAFIDEENCIGCIKCLSVCPADAILGAKKMLHSIIEQFCTGCTLCTIVCPTDCILMKKTNYSISIQSAKKRYLMHLKRIKLQQNNHKIINVTKNSLSNEEKRKQFIADAILRVKQKRKQ